MADKPKARAILRNVKPANGGMISKQFNLQGLISKCEAGFGQNMIQERRITKTWYNHLHSAIVGFCKVTLDVCVIHINH